MANPRTNSDNCGTQQKRRVRRNKNRPIDIFLFAFGYVKIKLLIVVNSLFNLRVFFLTLMLI